MSVLTGTTVFSNVTKKDVYMGAESKYNVTIVLSPEDAVGLAKAGVKVSEYKEVQQRKFASNYKPSIYGLDMEEFIGEIPRGSVVKIQYKLGDDHPVHGVTTYLEKIKVVEVGQGSMDEDF
jgi:hypothetical protein